MKLRMRSKASQRLAMLNAMADRLRTKIPGLPSNRILFALIGLLFVAVIIFVALQKFVAPRQPITTYTLPYTQSFDDIDLKHWFTESGVWTLRTGTLQQTIGGEEPGYLHVPLKLPEDAPYHASVFITLKKDTRQVGLSFNAQYPELIAKQHRVYISRLNPETLELVAGYVDETGAFLSQVQVPVTVNTTEFRLDVYVYSNSYLVQLNGQRLIENRPLFYKNGMVGFYTLGPAVFDNYQLTSAQNENPGDMVYTSDFDQEPGGAGWVPISGTWQIADGQLEQIDAAISDAAISYETSTFENYTLRATFSHQRGQGAGVLFNMPSPYAINGSQLVRYSDETDALIWGYFDETGIFNRQGFVSTSATGASAHTLQIYSGTNSYDIFLDDTMVARDIPLQSIHGTVGLTTSHSTAAFSYMEVFPLFGASQVAVSTIISPTMTWPATTSTVEPTQAAPTHLATQATVTPIVVDAVSGGDSPYHGVFSGKLSDAGWKILNGDWKFENGNFVQAKADGFDFAALYTRTAFKNFSLQTGFTHLEGSGAGVLFNMPNLDRLVGASMVRYSDRRDNAIIWGYFDATGVYKNQGYADVPNAGTDRHTLRVVGGDTSFSIYLDDRMIVQSVPYGSRQNAGYFGLITSRSRVVYDEIVVDSIGAVFKGSYSEMDGFTDQRVVSGRWTIASNEATQTVTDVADYIWNTGIQASDYTITARITLPDTDNSGAGFVIHMSERGSKNNSYIVRLKDGGNAIWWGSINDEGRFMGQGSAPIEKIGNTFTLKLIVNLDHITIFVNDREIVTGVTISSQDGWIGLLSYGGPVTFEDMRLDVNK